MKHTAYTIGVAAAALMAACGSNNAPRLQSRQDTLSWAMGENIAYTLQHMQSPQLDSRLVREAFDRVMDGGERVLDDSTMTAAMTEIAGMQQLSAMRQSSEAQEQADRLQQQYFAQLQQEHPDVKKHPSGFYYEVLKEGTGRTPKYSERVSFDYRSFTMFDGKPWDQTYGKRDPIVHGVGKPMFQGLVEGLQLMRAGSIYRFYFPYQLAFGAQGSGSIAGYTPFIYEVELHQVFDD